MDYGKKQVELKRIASVKNFINFLEESNYRNNSNITITRLQIH